jgi:AcrR family transcriptional regulator
MPTVTEIGALARVLEDVPLVSDDAMTEQILAAALAEFEAHGLRRTTVEEVTRRAGVGRMTIHRRFPTKQSLVEAVFLREIRRVLIEMDDVVNRQETLVDRLAEGLAFGIHRAREHTLFTRLLETDTEAMLPYLTTQAHDLMVAATEYVAYEMRQSPEWTGTPQATNQVAEIIIRFCHSILLTPDGPRDLRDKRRLRALVRRAIEGFLS